MTVKSSVGVFDSCANVAENFAFDGVDGGSGGVGKRYSSFRTADWIEQN